MNLKNKTTKVLSKLLSMKYKTLYWYVFNNYSDSVVVFVMWNLMREDSKSMTCMYGGSPACMVGHLHSVESSWPLGYACTS